jgi:hypothetical protein
MLCQNKNAGDGSMERSVFHPWLDTRKEKIMNWKNMPLSHKIATVIAGLAVAVWLVHRVQPNLLPIDPTYPAIAVFTVCEAVVCWKE